jgi:transcriptional/translational regulatory protein YebC/TACO1
MRPPSSFRGADEEVEHLGTDHPGVEHVRALGHHARPVARGQLGRAEAHVAAQAHTQVPGRLARKLRQDADEGAADLLGHVAVDLLAVEAPHVVGLEDLGGDGHGGASYVSLAAMAGHSKWAGIKHKKAIVDARRGKLFTKLARAITVAAKEGGGDPEANPALALAVQKARDASMPKDNIERAIAKGTGEGRGRRRARGRLLRGLRPGRRGDPRGRAHGQPQPHGRRDAPPLLQARRQPRRAGVRRPILFDKRGLVVVDGERWSEDDLLPAIEAGALDVAADDDVFEVLTEPADLATVRAALEEAGVEPESAEVVQYPRTRVPLEAEAARRVVRLVEALEDNDDVSEVHANFDVDADVLAQVAGDS